MAEITIVKCPFCKKGNIKVLHTPRLFTTQTIIVGSNKKTIPRLRHEKNEVLTKCPNCGKGKSSIQKRMNEGKKIPAEEIAKRLKEAGLPTRF